MNTPIVKKGDMKKKKKYRRGEMEAYKVIKSREVAFKDYTEVAYLRKRLRVG